MGQITGGVVKYGRTLNLGDYNSKRADVEIGFNAAEDGSDHQAMLDLAGTTAIAKVHELLALAEPAKAKAVAPVAAAPVGPTKADLAKTAEAAAGKPVEAAKPVGRPPAKKPPPPPAPPVEAVDPAAMGDGLDDLIGEPVPVVVPPAKEITDQDIVAAITRKNQALKDGGCTTGAQMIRTLIGEFIPPPGQARQIGQDKRGDFLKKLDALKPAT